MRNSAMGLVLGALFTLVPVTLALAKGDEKKGEILAKQWCATCHVVASEQQSANPDAPSFASIAADPLKSNDYLTGFLIDPHPPMPDMNLSRQEIADIVAYIKALN